MTSSNGKRMIMFLSSLLLLLSQPVWAHHVMGGMMPQTFLQGLLSGFGHPMIGLDHLAFIIGVGLLSLRFKQRYLLPLAFVAATLAGTGIHLQLINLPAVELCIALSVVIMGILLIADAKLPLALTAALFALAGLFHGYAYGESIVGAETSPLLAYLLGFGLIQYAIAVATMRVVTMLSMSSRFRESFWLRTGGGAVAAVGAVFLLAQVV
jgi:urease accessory protein